MTNRGGRLTGRSWLRVLQRLLVSAALWAVAVDVGGPAMAMTGSDDIVRHSAPTASSYTLEGVTGVSIRVHQLQLPAAASEEPSGGWSAEAASKCSMEGFKCIAGGVSHPLTQLWIAMPSWDATKGLRRALMSVASQELPPGAFIAGRHLQHTYFPTCKSRIFPLPLAPVGRIFLSYCIQYSGHQRLTISRTVLAPSVRRCGTYTA